MSRLVVHSRNSALPFALGTAGHDVVVVDQVADVRWSEYVSFAEVVLLDVDDPASCAVLVDGIGQSASGTQNEVRVLLLAGANLQWRDVPERSQGVHILPLPLTMPKLSEAISDLMAGPPLPTQATTPGVSRVIDVRTAAPVGSGPASLAGSPTTSYAVPTALPEAPETVTTPQRAAPPVPRTLSLVRALTGSLDELHTVVETAEIVVAEALAQVPSDAGAVMVRDGTVWRVAHGVGLRSREERLTLSPQHWLVSRASDACGVILCGGEGRWPQLYGVPLSWRVNLLALPLPPTGAMLLLARDDEEYEGQDLQTLLEFGDEAGHLIADAVDIRKLARLLEPYVDPMD